MSSAVATALNRTENPENTTSLTGPRVQKIWRLLAVEEDDTDIRTGTLIALRADLYYSVTFGYDGKTKLNISVSDAVSATEDLGLEQKDLVGPVAKTAIEVARN